MKRKVVFLFPGQGAQYSGMGQEFYRSFPIVRETFEEASDFLQSDLRRILFEGSEETLSQTLHSQIGIFVTSWALLRATCQQIPNLNPFACSGLSLGEYTALCATKRLNFLQTLDLVQKRATLMSEACTQSLGTMAAVLGLDAEKVEHAIASVEDVTIANYNSPGQLVISGGVEALERASVLLKERGAKRVIPLAVQGAFHSRRMGYAQDRLAPWLEKAPLQPSETALVMNVPGDFALEEKIAEHLTLQVTHSVRWHQGICALEREGVDFYIEMGPGKTLTQLNRKIGVQATSLSIDRLEDLEILAQKLDAFTQV